MWGLFANQKPSISPPATDYPTKINAVMDELDARYGKSADIASAATTDLSTLSGGFAHITGTTAITGLGTLPAGMRVLVMFAGILTLTNGANVILPTGANITTAAGDIAEFVSEGAGVWRCVFYSRASGASLTTFGAGAVGTPSIFMNTHTTSGFYEISSGDWGWSSGGTKVLDFSSAGLSSAGTLSAGAGLVGTPGIYLNGHASSGFYEITSGAWGWSSGGTKTFDIGAAGINIALAGAVGTPALWLNGHGTTGFWEIASGNWGWSSGGANVINMNSSGLSVSGSVVASNSMVVTAGTLTGSAGMLTPSLAVQGSDVNPIGNGSFSDIVSLTLGSGTWFVFGQVTIQDPTNTVNVQTKLHDGTTVIASGYTTLGAAPNRTVVHLCGYITNPSAAMRMSCKSTAGTTKALANETTLGRDGYVTAIRIG